MKMTMNRRLAAAIAATLMAVSAQASTPAQDNYKAAKARISAEYKVDRTACATLKHNTKDICMVQADGRRKVARAELEFGHSGAAADQERVEQVRAVAEHALGKQRCADLAGNGKDVCLKEAMAIKTKAMVDARTAQKVVELKKDAAQEKRDADFSVAAQKCDALAGNAKASCAIQAKANFGKN